VDPTVACKDLGLTSRPFSAGPYGKHRGDVADDFSVPLLDGTTWSFKASFSGCESYVFIPDTIPVSQRDTTSLWANQNDLTGLVNRSPTTVHCFFVSRAPSDAAADIALQAQAMRIATTLGKLPATDQPHWKDRLHVVGKRASMLPGWLPGVFSTHGRLGFSI